MKGTSLINLFRKNLANIFTILIVALMLISYRVWAAPGSFMSASFAPGVIPYQGNLTDPIGQPINGNVNMNFKIYNVDSGGSPLWTEAHTSANAVPVSNGVFNVLLGSLSPIPSSVWTNSQLYLGIQVGGDAEMTPRQVIGAVPAALQAATALTVPDSAISSRGFAPSIYRDANTANISTASTTPLTTNVSISVACETACSVLILHRSMVAHSIQNGGVSVQVLVNGSLAFTESAAAMQPYSAGDLARWSQVSGWKFVDLPVGLHTIEVKYYCLTAGTCYYYGSNDGKEMESLSAIVFARP
jgi:hypothetical protein